VYSVACGLHLASWLSLGGVASCFLIGILCMDWMGMERKPESGLLHQEGSIELLCTICVKIHLSDPLGCIVLFVD
jgi:hypothetical protein